MLFYISDPLPWVVLAVQKFWPIVVGTPGPVSHCLYEVVYLTKSNAQILRKPGGRAPSLCMVCVSALFLYYPISSRVRSVMKDLRPIYNDRLLRRFSSEPRIRSRFPFQIKVRQRHLTTLSFSISPRFLFRYGR